MEPLVSVLIPVFNVLPYLREALDSVIHQTYSNMDTRQNPGQSVAFQREQWMTAQEALAALLEGHIRHYVWDKLYLRELWEGIRFPKGQLFEDISTTYRVINKGGCVLTITGHQIMHRIRPDSISQTNTAKNIQARMDAFANMEQFLEAHIPGLFDERLARSVQKKHFHMAIANWCRLPWKEQTEAKECRKSIMQSKTMTMEESLIRWKIAIVLFRFFPFLIPVSYPAYQFLKRMLRLNQ